MVRARDFVDNLHGFLTAAVKSTPDKAAIIQTDGAGGLAQTSYARLAAEIERYAAVLDGLGLDVGDRVMVESATSASAVAMLLACSALGLPFVPVSPEVPDHRVATIADAVEPALYVRAPGCERPGLVADLGTATPGTALFDAGEVDVDRRPLDRIRHRREVLAVDTAYIIFTSGTTGRPKGVVMSHRSVVTFLRAVLGDGFIRSDERVASTSPLHFDFALFDIGTTLGAGATLIPVREQLGSPRRMIGILSAAGATQINGVPSIWRPVLRHDPELLKELPTLRNVMFAGEEFPLPELRRLQEAVQGVRVVNGYGATESMACSFTDVPNPLPADAERLSIAAVHTGAEVTLIDEDGAVVDEPGAVGEMYLRSPSLFNGYWNDPEASAAVLVPDPVDGRHGGPVFRTGDLAYRDEHGGLYYCGRVDTQVQIRGNRVELGEVEATLARFPGVDAAAVTAVAKPGGDRVLAAHLVLNPSWSELDEAKVLEFCGLHLPAYMVPRHIHLVPELPLTANGKVDRALLARATPARRSGPSNRSTRAKEATT